VSAVTENQASQARWSAGAMPSQAGRIAVVTGSSGGVGLETARELAARGATVILACRDLAKARRAAESIRAGAPLASLRIVHLDLADLASVRAAAAEIRAGWSRLDLLINNAGVMQPPYRVTEDGFELTFATNHLGHFALTGLLIGQLAETPGARIVTVSSVSHHDGEMQFDDLHYARRYSRSQAYQQSKLANLLFAYELEARLREAGAAAISLAAHPGVVRTELWRTSSRLEQTLGSPRLRALTSWLAQDPAGGALPSLRAATDPAARGGEYYGPSGWHEYTGAPIQVRSSDRSHDEAVARRLWEVSEQLTGVRYDLRPTAARGEPGSPSAGVVGGA
jgi:NAD(P)-dependent dehydrogenase (short-subunit alcohol dehydrogenase family)